jgi:lipid II:glycine glycyltransferase (peptidoglycan interpeptide bridge formation enzyme)
MNANELADELDKSREESYTSEHLVGKAATMLRQQQSEIEALKDKLMLTKQSLEIVEGWVNHG